MEREEIIKQLYEALQECCREKYEMYLDKIKETADRLKPVYADLIKRQLLYSM